MCLNVYVQSCSLGFIESSIEYKQSSWHLKLLLHVQCTCNLRFRIILNVRFNYKLNSKFYSNLIYCTACTLEKKSSMWVDGHSFAKSMEYRIPAKINSIRLVHSILSLVAIVFCCCFFSKCIKQKHAPMVWMNTCCTNILWWCVFIAITAKIFYSNCSEIRVWA